MKLSNFVWLKDTGKFLYAQVHVTVPKWFGLLDEIHIAVIFKEQSFYNWRFLSDGTYTPGMQAEVLEKAASMLWPAWQDQQLAEAQAAFGG